MKPHCGWTFLPLEEIERRHVLRVLKAVGDNKVALRKSQIGRATIYQILSE